MNLRILRPVFFPHKEGDAHERRKMVSSWTDLRVEAFPLLDACLLLGVSQRLLSPPCRVNQVEDSCVGVLCVFFLTLLEPQSRFGDNWGQHTWNLSGLSPKRDWSSKRFFLPVDTSTSGVMCLLSCVLFRYCMR